MDCAALDGELATYRDLGLACAAVSCRSGAGLGDLAGRLTAGATLLVGQSGVGKSTLVNALVPASEAHTADLGRDREGRHTTTTVHRYRYGERAALIDAPGVRDFAPPQRTERSAERGFVEIVALAANCRFGDCSHLREPDCAVRAAVDTGTVSPRRYESYRRLRRRYAMISAR